MKRGDKIFFQAAGFQSGYRLVKDVRDEMVPPVCKITNGNSDMWVRQSECELASVKEARDSVAELAAMHAKYIDIIEAWQRGARTLKEIAEALKVPNIGLWPRVDAAKRKGLIRE